MAGGHHFFRAASAVRPGVGTARVRRRNLSVCHASPSAVIRRPSPRTRRPAPGGCSRAREDARARDSARVKLATALRRGTFTRRRCRECGAGEVVGSTADPGRWREVVWACRAHRETEPDRRQDAAAQQAAWYDERACVIAAIELLPPVEQSQVCACAARGPAVAQPSPGAASLFTPRRQSDARPGSQAYILSAWAECSSLFAP